MRALCLVARGSGGNMTRRSSLIVLGDAYPGTRRMIKLSPLVLATTLIAGSSALAQNAGANSPTPAGSSNITPSGSPTGVNSLTGATTGTGVGVTNNPTPRIRTPRNSQLNTGTAGMRRGRR